jgi:hypothetical protein
MLGLTDRLQACPPPSVQREGRGHFLQNVLERKRGFLNMCKGPNMVDHICNPGSSGPARQKDQRRARAKFGRLSLKNKMQNKVLTGSSSGRVFT